MRDRSRRTYNTCILLLEVVATHRGRRIYLRRRLGVSPSHRIEISQMWSNNRIEFHDDTSLPSHAKVLILSLILHMLSTISTLLRSPLSRARPSGYFPLPNKRQRYTANTVYDLRKSFRPPLLRILLHNHPLSFPIRETLRVDNSLCITLPSVTSTRAFILTHHTIPCISPDLSLLRHTPPHAFPRSGEFRSSDLGLYEFPHF
jgi:hypothetical protein